MQPNKNAAIYGRGISICGETLNLFSANLRSAKDAAENVAPGAVVPAVSSVVATVLAITLVIALHEAVTISLR